MAKPAIVCGDSLKVMRRMEENTYHAIVTDPPYGIRIASKAWDAGVPGREYWRETLAVLRGTL